MSRNLSKQSGGATLRPFVHLHTHTEFSQYDGIAKIDELVDKVIADGMPGIAITDHANMFGIKKFVDCVRRKHEEGGTNFKPIIGCEVYVARRGMEYKEEREDFAGYHLVLLAKNYIGYKNLIKLVSRSWTEGFYGRARTDKRDLERYHEGLICCSACIGGEVAQHILNGNLAEAEESAKWYKKLFGEDYYFELQRHSATAERANYFLRELEDRVNDQLLALSEKLGVKYICTNDIHFVNEADAEAQDTFICMTWSKRYDDPGRLVFSKQEWMKTTAEMNTLFGDIPEALDTTVEILDKVEVFSIDHAPILPKPTLPDGVDEVEYLARLTFEGARKRFGKVLPVEVKERLKDELRAINHRGYPAYFLMWHEIVTAARDLDAWIGAGRGSMGCSLVAYCLDFTQIDPLKWDLPFEQFIDANGTALPDMDVDLDMYGCERVMAWIKERFGENCVANVAIASGYYNHSNTLNSVVAEVYGQSLEEMTEYTRGIAERLGGVKRWVKPHACSVAICGESLSDWVPMAYIYDSKIADRVVVTQYSGAELEDSGVVVLDILGLNYLDVMKRAVANIGHNRGVAVDIENIPLDDAKTLSLFSCGETVGVFQFESATMQNALRNVRPRTFEAVVDVLSSICKERAHAIGYSLIAYQTAYLKANYPAEYMEALLYCNRHVERRVEMYTEECRRMGVAW